MTKCDLCGFHLGKLDALFGPSEMVMDQITDTTHLLRAADKEAILLEIDKFEGHFPQFFPAFYFGAPPKEAHLRVFAAWLLNRARVQVDDELRNNENAFVFVIDPARATMTAVAGYYAEHFVDEAGLREVLEEAALDFANQQLAAGVIKLLRGLTRSLRRLHRGLAKSGS